MHSTLQVPAPPPGTAADPPADAAPLAALAARLARELARLAPAATPAGIGPDDAAAFVAMSRSTLDTYVSAGLVPGPARVGGKCIFSRQKLESWLAHGCPPAAEFEPIWRKLLAAPVGGPTRR